MEAVIGLVWLASWIATPIVAHSKQRSAFGWFLLALLFGGFALLVVALLPKRLVQTAPQPNLVVAVPGDVHQQAAAAPHVLTRQCPHCLSDIPQAASVCRYCQRDVTPLMAPTQPAIEQAKPLPHADA